MFLRVTLLLGLAALLSAPVYSQHPSSQPPAEPADAEPLTKEEVSYMIGVMFGMQVTYGSDLLDPEIMVKAMQDVFAENELEMTEQEMQSVLNRFSLYMQENRSKEFQEDGAAFLKSKAEEDGVKVTGSGLMYKVVKEGSGKTPVATDTVRVHYTGTFTDGSVFDSSQGGEPVEFQLNQVIPGWTEGVQLMKEGATYEFYIPYTLAYGEAGAPRGQIPPYSTLVFSVELLAVLDEAAAQ